MNESYLIDVPQELRDDAQKFVVNYPISPKLLEQHSVQLEGAVNNLRDFIELTEARTKDSVSKDLTELRDAQVELALSQFMNLYCVQAPDEEECLYCSTPRLERLIEKTKAKIITQAPDLTNELSTEDKEKIVKGKETFLKLSGSTVDRFKIHGFNIMSLRETVEQPGPCANSFITKDKRCVLCVECSRDCSKSEWIPFSTRYFPI